MSPIRSPCTFSRYSKLSQGPTSWQLVACNLILSLTGKKYFSKFDLQDFAENQKAKVIEKGNGIYFGTS